MDGVDAVTCGFGEEHFGAAEVGDVRRTRRLVQLAETVVRHPGGALPDKVNHPASLKALYRLMNCDAVTHETVDASSRQRTLARMAEVEGTVLVIHDWTELNYSGLKSIDGLGQIGNGQARGYLVHHALAVVAETRDVIGLAHQTLAKRPKVKKNETRAQKRDRPDRESRLWKRASQDIPASPPGRRQIEVADRGADVLEFIDFVEGAGKSYLVRSPHNRQMFRENDEKSKLHEDARQLPAVGQKTIEVPAGKTQPARTATVSIAWAKVTLQIPLQPRGEVRGTPLTTWVVCVREVDPPAGVQPVEWILLTNVPVPCLADAEERIAWYESRWIIEEYHKALKTGCGIETWQFTTEKSLKPAIAFLSVIALFLLNLRNASRQPDAQQRRATDLFPVAFVVALSIWRYKQPREDLTVQEFYYALARRGGHQNRKHDHRPGWLVLWRGWMKLQPMIEATLALGWKRCG